MVPISSRNLSQMTLISFVDGIRVRPKVSFRNCASDQRTYYRVDSGTGLYGTPSETV